jgi:hypothetical protein
MEGVESPLDDRHTRHRPITTRRHSSALYAGARAVRHILCMRWLVLPHWRMILYGQPCAWGMAAQLFEWCPRPVGADRRLDLSRHAV